jgi:hypothetical protein
VLLLSSYDELLVGRRRRRGLTLDADIVPFIVTDDINGEPDRRICCDDVDDEPFAR